MNKKIIIPLLLSATIVTGTKIPVFAKEQCKNEVVNSYISDSDYNDIENMLYYFGYPIHGVTYNITSEPVFAGTLYHIKVYSDDIFLSGGNITIRTHGLGSVSYTGIDKKEVIEVAGKPWKQKVKLSLQDAINYTKNHVYNTTQKTITQEQIEIKELSLVKINSEYAPYYSIKVTFKDTGENLNLLLNAENGNFIVH